MNQQHYITSGLIFCPKCYDDNPLSSGLPELSLLTLPNLLFSQVFLLFFSSVMFSVHFPAECFFSPGRFWIHFQCLHSLTSRAVPVINASVWPSVHWVVDSSWQESRARISMLVLSVLSENLWADVWTCVWFLSDVCSLYTFLQFSLRVSACLTREWAELWCIYCYWCPSCK